MCLFYTTKSEKITVDSNNKKKGLRNLKKILSAVMAMVMLFTLGLTQISAEEATAQEAVKFYSNGKTYNLTNGQVIPATAEGMKQIGATIITNETTVSAENGRVFFESTGAKRKIGFPLSTNGNTYKYFKLSIKSSRAFTGDHGLRVNLVIPDSADKSTEHVYRYYSGNGSTYEVLDILKGEHDYYLDVTKFKCGDTYLTVEETAQISRFYLDDYGWYSGGGDITWGLGECEFTNNSVLPLVTIDTDDYKNFAAAVGGVGQPISYATEWSGGYNNFKETNAVIRKYCGPANNWKIISYRGGLAFASSFTKSQTNVTSDTNAFICSIKTSIVNAGFLDKINDYGYFRFWAKTDTARPFIFSLYNNEYANWDSSFVHSLTYTIPENHEGWVYIPVSDILTNLEASSHKLSQVQNITIRMRDLYDAGTVIFDEVELCTSNEEKDLRSPVIKLSTFTDEPVLVKKTSKSVIFEAVEGMEYSLNGVDWQTSSEFTGLSAGKYLFYVRNAADPFGPHSVPVSIKVHKMGDIDGNGKVDASDITILKQKLLGIDVEADRFAVDVTENGVTDILDLVKIKKLSVTA